MEDKNGVLANLKASMEENENVNNLVNKINFAD